MKNVNFFLYTMALIAQNYCHQWKIERSPNLTASWFSKNVRLQLIVAGYLYFKFTFYKIHLARIAYDVYFYKFHSNFS